MSYLTYLLLFFHWTMLNANASAGLVLADLFYRLFVQDGVFLFCFRYFFM